VALTVESARNRNRLLKVNVRKSSSIAMLHRTVSPASSLNLEQFKEGKNLDKGQERLLSASADCGYFGNKTFNAFELSEGVK